MPDDALSCGAIQSTACREGRASPRNSETNVTDDPDSGLVALAQAGDTRAFELLLRKHQHRIIALTRRIVGEADCEDVAQEAFIRAFRALPGFRGHALFSTWLYRIALNGSRNHLQTRNSRPCLQDIDVADAEQSKDSERLSHNNSPENEVLSEEIRQRIAYTIGQLPEDLRLAITLREMQGLSYEAIAYQMQCPMGTVRSRLFRAREAIDKDLAPLLT